VRVSLACDAICSRIATKGSGVTLAFVQTPSQAFVLPQAAVDAADAAYTSSYLQYLGYERNARPAVKTAEGEPPRYVHNGYVVVQGPNYALAKAINLWRTVLARNRDGLRVSTNVAPACRTASMQHGNKNARLVSAALSGMGNFAPMLAFDAQTVSALMAAMLVHDVRNPHAPANPEVPLSHPWDLFSCQAFHGGSFRVGVKPQALSRLFGLTGFVWPSNPRPTLKSDATHSSLSSRGSVA